MSDARVAAVALALAWVVLSYVGNCGATTLAQATSNRAELDRFVHDVCDKQVVLLGEDANHGSGATLAVKVELVRQLVDKCGYNAVAFESGIYDFVGLERALADRTATASQLAGAIGALWSTTQEIQPLVSYLFAKASVGKLRIVGLDLQPGGVTYVYAQQRLPAQLAGYLAGERREECRTEIDRLTNWRYDDKDTVYDDATRARLHACLVEIEDNATRRPDDAAAAIDSVMARNVSRSLDVEGKTAFAVRDRAMYENLMWHRARLGKNVRVVVWCATIHALKGAPPSHADLSTLGSYIHASLGKSAAAIGFTALTGTYGRAGQAVQTLASAPSGSLEAHALQNSTSTLRYLDGAELAAFGVTPARPIDYGHYDSTNWGSLLDSLFVLRVEQPPHVVTR